MPIKNIKGLAFIASPIPLKPIFILSKSKFLKPCPCYPVLAPSFSTALPFTFAASPNSPILSFKSVTFFLASA